MALIITKKKIIAKRIIQRGSNYLGDYKKDRSVHLFNHERVRSSRVIGWCHNVIHHGYIDSRLLEQHKCLNVSSRGTKCEYFEQINNMYWHLTQKTNSIPQITAKQKEEVTDAQIAELSVAIDETQRRRKNNRTSQKINKPKPPIEKIMATAKKLLLEENAYMTSLRDFGDYYEVTYIAEDRILLKNVSYILHTLYGKGFKIRYVRTDIEKVRYLLKKAKSTENI